MEQNYIESSVKKRLILAGLAELSEHGISDFSLRRVALAAQVSCAAPYKHFKDREELISAVISHVTEDWLLLAGQIESLYADSPVERIICLATAAVRFWLSNYNFRAAVILHGDGASASLSAFEQPIRESVGSLGGGEGQLFALLSLIYGTVELIHLGEFEVDKALALLRDGISSLAW